MVFVSVGVFIFVDIVSIDGVLTVFIRTNSVTIVFKMMVLIILFLIVIDWYLCYYYCLWRSKR